MFKPSLMLKTKEQIHYSVDADPHGIQSDLGVPADFAGVLWRRGMIFALFSVFFDFFPENR